MPLVDIIGYAATVVGTSLMLPQTAKLLRTKKAGDLSLAMAVLYVANCALWLCYGILLKAHPMNLANSIGVVIGVVQLILVIKYQHNT